MGSALPVMSGREVVHVFESLGWEVVPQTGSHIIMIKGEEPATLSVSATSFLAVIQVCMTKSNCYR